MKLQHILEDISTVKKAFDIKNFVKVEAHPDGDIYWFLSMQRFKFDTTSNTYEHSTSIYHKEHSYPWEDTYSAFQELQVEIDNQVINQMSQNPIPWKKEYEAKPVTGPNNSIHDPLFCSCNKPNLVKSNAGGEIFDYCKDCKKEHKLQILIIGRDSTPSQDDDFYFF